MDQEKEFQYPEMGMQPAPNWAEVREATGKSLRDISKASRIRMLYLEAIEKEEYSLLPEPIYAETFIRTYAREIGVREEAILSRYKNFLQRTSPPEQKVDKERNSWLPKDSWKIDMGKVRVYLRVFGWIASVLVAVGFLVSFFIAYTDEPTKPEIVKAPVETAPTPAAETQPAPPADPAAPPADPGAGPAAPVPGEKVKPEERTAPEPAPAPAPAERAAYKLVIEAGETTWLNIIEDDNPPYEIMLRAGERIEREASERFMIDVGNAGGVDVRFQGKSLGRLGNSGEVVHLVLPRNPGRN